MMCWSGFAKRSFALIVFLAVFLAPEEPLFGSRGPAGSAREGEQAAKILGVRKVLRNQYFLSRYPQIHYYILYISIIVSDQTYCTEYETPVLDEIADVSSATNQDISVVVKGKTITIRTPMGRKLKTRLVNGNQCKDLIN